MNYESEVIQEREPHSERPARVPDTSHETRATTNTEFSFRGNEFMDAEEMSKLPSTLAKLTKKIIDLRNDLEEEKRNVILMLNDLKTIQSLAVRYSKRHLKQLEKDTQQTTAKKPRGFACPKRVSNELCEFMGVPYGSELSRTNVSSYISKYIETNKLQNPLKKNIIVPDEKLARLFGAEALNAELTYFTMQKYITPHFNQSA